MIKAVEALVAGFSEPDVSEAEQGSFRELLEALPAAVYTTDATGTITFCNRAAIDMAGRTPVIGRDQWCVTFRLYHPDGTPLPHEQCPMAIALKEQRPVRDVEIMAERPDGQLVPVMPFPTPLFDRSGKLVGAVNVLVNISKLKAAEAGRRAAGRRAGRALSIHRSPLSRDQRAGCGGRRAGCNRRRAVGRGGPRSFCSTKLVSRASSAGAVCRTAIVQRSKATAPGSPASGMRSRFSSPISTLPTSRNRSSSVVRAEGIRGLAFIPVTANGGVIGKFMTYYQTAHIFSDDERALAVTLARQLGFALERQRIESDRKRAEAQRDLLVAELNHRVKNTLATVISVARQSFAKGPSLEHALKSFDGRLRALAHTHNRLAEIKLGRGFAAQVAGGRTRPLSRDRWQQHRDEWTRHQARSAPRRRAWHGLP